MNPSPPSKSATDMEKYNALATVRSGEGYLAFLDFVTVDAQPDKRPFRHIAEKWQWARAKRIAPALDHLCGILPVYSGPRSYWNGYHKGSDKTHETARELCFILGWAKRRVNIVVCAGKEDQAALITKAMRGILADNSWIADRVSVTELTAGGESGSTVEILSMNAFGAQGAFPDYIVAEEITHWQHNEGKDFWESFVLGSMNKRPHCVLNVTTNAGLKGSWQWAERNRIQEDTKYWSFYEAPVGPPLPSWMDHDKIEADSQGMSPGERDRLYKNRWVDPGEEHGYLTLADAQRCEDPTLTERVEAERYRGYQYFVSVDYGGVHDRCAMSVMHIVPGTDEVIVDRMDCWQGTHENRIAIVRDEGGQRSVEDWLEVVRSNFQISAFVLDPFQMEALAIKYERKGLRVLRFPYRTGRNNHRMAQLLKTCVQNRKIRWSPLAGLLPESITIRDRVRPIEDRTFSQELSMLVTRPTVLGYKFDHEAGRYSDRACSVAMGLVYAFPETQPEGSVGPKLVPDTRPNQSIMGSPADRRRRDDAAVGRWNIMGAGGNVDDPEGW